MLLQSRNQKLWDDKARSLFYYISTGIMGNAETAGWARKFHSFYVCDIEEFVESVVYHSFFLVREIVYCAGERKC